MAYPYLDTTLSRPLGHLNNNRGLLGHLVVIHCE